MAARNAARRTGSIAPRSAGESGIVVTTGTAPAARTRPTLSASKPKSGMAGDAGGRLFTRPAFSFASASAFARYFGLRNPFSLSGANAPAIELRHGRPRRIDFRNSLNLRVHTTSRQSAPIEPMSRRLAVKW